MRCDRRDVMHVWRHIGVMLVLLMAPLPLVAQPVIWTSGTFTYDGAGNITFAGTDAYVYDELGRLTSGTADFQRTGAFKQQSYTYDAFGNLAA